MAIGPNFIITSCTKQEMADVLGLSPAYRSTQLFHAIYHGAMDWQDVSVFPKDLRQRCANLYPLISSRFVKKYQDNQDTKLVLRLVDGKHVETVLLVDKNGRKTACVSCQVGCAMGCTFCKTGLLGLLRNLEAGEIVEQILHLQKLYGTIDNVVYMGMGEPLNNLNEVIKSIRLLHAPDGLGMSLRRFTISTCGLVAGIRRLIEEQLPVRLAFSLVTADQGLREKLMYTAKANPLWEIKKSLIEYQQYTQQRITLEAALLAGYNDRPQDARLISEFVQGLDYMFNLIPWNPVPGLSYRRPNQQEIQTFTDHLHHQGIHIVRRYQRGANVAAACGQLGADVENLLD
ncbi:MAG: 23S rRNA (adenine(2503)-C(2))-methyltransferase RlmN [Spirochaetia bacterium]